MEVDTSPKQKEQVDVSPLSELRIRETPRHYRRWLIVAAAIVVCGFAGLALSKFFAKAPTAAVKTKVPSVTVTAENASSRPMLRTIKVNGTIWPWDPLTIGSEVNGLKIESILVDDGAIVSKGQVLAKLDSSVLQAQLDQERARLDVNQAALSKSIQPNRPEDILSLRAALAQSEANISQEKAGLVRAQANLNNAMENSRRYLDLVKQGAVSAQDADNRDTDAKTAQADVRTAEQKVKAAQFAQAQALQRLHLAEQGGRKEDVQMSRATVAASKATVQQLEAQVAQTVIRSPCQGMIMKRDGHLGDITSAGKSLFSIVRDNRLELRAQVPEVQLSKLHAGMSVDITDGAGAEAVVKGAIREISPLIDQDTRLGTVRIDVPGSGGFKPGNFVRGDINIGQGLALTVPSPSVFTKDDQSFVYVVDSDNQVHNRAVKAGARNAGLVEILSGLSDKDTVVVKGAGFVKDGDYVRVGPSQ